LNKGGGRGEELILFSRVLEWYSHGKKQGGKSTGSTRARQMWKRGKKGNVNALTSRLDSRSKKGSVEKKSNRKSGGGHKSMKKKVSTNRTTVLILKNRRSPGGQQGEGKGRLV